MRNRKPKKSRKKNGSETDIDIYSEMGIAREDWELHVDFNKGALSGGRGVTVLVQNLKTGLRKKLSARCGVKNECYQVRDALLRDAIAQLR